VLDGTAAAIDVLIKDYGTSLGMAKAAALP
jgi:hypothetical protein